MCCISYCEGKIQNMWVKKFMYNFKSFKKVNTPAKKNEQGSILH